MSKRLELALLGDIEIRHGGTPVTQHIVGKTLALLCYLAVTGRPHTRSALAGLLWGGMPESKARGNLSKALSTLRRCFGENLIITRQTVSFEREGDCWLDVQAFEAAVSGVDIERLQEAVGLYQGDFMEGFYLRDALEFEHWLLAQRARLHELALKALHTLAVHIAEEGAAGRATAIDYTARLLRLEPWREEAHRRMMRLLALHGQRGAALAQYETCCQVLADELGVEPGPETTALYEQIRDGELRAEVDKLKPSPLPRHRPALPGFLQDEGTPVIPERPLFVARENELNQLDGLLKRTLAGQGRVAFVIGEPGSGKTFLVNQFIRRALEKDPDLVAAAGSCNAYGGIGDPYLPFREILALLTGDVEDRWRAGAISREHARRLWALLPRAVPALVDAGPDLLDIFLSAPALRDRAALAAAEGAAWLVQLDQLLAQKGTRRAQPRLEQADLFGMYTKFLRALAQHRPIILVLDDLQWADAGSISLLFHLGRRLAGRPILVLGVYRPDDVALGREGKRHPLEPVVHEFQRLFGEKPVDLGRAEGERFVDRVLDAETNRLRPAFRRALYRHTRGHALFTVEMVQGMQERGDLVQEENGCWVEGAAVDWEHLPARIEGVIAERIARLPATVQETLKIASVEGEFFTGEVVAQVQGLRQSEMVRRLSSVLGRTHRLVKSRDSRLLDKRRLSRYRFQHILFQKYLYNSLDEVERTLLHERVGNALEELYVGRTAEVAVHLARHFQSGGILDHALSYWGQAGDVAAHAYAKEEAIAHYRRALDLAKRMGVSGETLTALYSRLGRTLELDSQFEQALATYQDMGRIAHRRDDHAMALAALMARVTIQAVPTAVHDPAQAQTLGEQALALAVELGDRAAEAKILWNLALAYYFGNKPDQAITCGERSLALARENNLRVQMAQTLNDLGSFCYMYSGRIAQAKAALREASQLWRELGDMPMLADSLASSAVAHVLAGEFNQAIGLSERADQIGQSIDNLWTQSYSKWKVGLAYWERGECSEAIRIMEESIHLAELAGFLIPQTNTRAELAALLGELGAVECGLEKARLALSIAETQNPVQIGHHVGILAQLLLVKGDLDSAKSRIEAAREDPYRESWPVFYVTVPIAEAELALKLGEFDRALEITGELLTELRQCGMRLYLAHALYLQGQAFLGLDQIEAAHECLAGARAAAQAIGSRWRHWRILHLLSQVEANPVKAEGLRQQAQEIVEYIAAHLDCEHADLRQSFLNLPDVRAVCEWDLSTN
jgi:adenylate cyclase